MAGIGDELNLPAPIFVHGGIRPIIEATLDHVGIRTFQWGSSPLGNIISFCVDREDFFEACEILVAHDMKVEGYNTDE